VIDGEFDEMCDNAYRGIVSGIGEGGLLNDDSYHEVVNKFFDDYCIE
jgi:hypothetical protein